jgi:tetratricopeptide (TPR) repeat protein
MHGSKPKRTDGRKPAPSPRLAASMPADRTSAADQRRAGLFRGPEVRGFALGVILIAVLTAVLSVTTPRANRPRLPTDSPDPEAEPLLAQLAANPEDVDARLRLTQLYLRHKNLRDARLHAAEALRLAPENAQALTYQGLILLASGQPESALSPLQAAIARNPNLVESYLQLAYAYVRLDRMAEAEATIAAASRRFPQRAASLNRLLGKLIDQTAQDRGKMAGDVAR